MVKSYHDRPFFNAGQGCLWGDPAKAMPNRCEKGKAVSQPASPVTRFSPSLRYLPRYIKGETPSISTLKRLHVTHLPFRPTTPKN